MDFNPDIIYHLAAQSSVGVSIAKPYETLDVNINGTINVLDTCVNQLKCKPKVMLIGSAEIYKSPEGESALKEGDPLEPLSPYAVSKVTVEQLGRIYWLNYKLKTFMTRSFNHLGPGQTTNFVMPSFAKQIAMIEKKLIPPVMKVGNLEAKRDFSDVRDVVGAYTSIMSLGKEGDEYNICSGEYISIREMLDILLSFSDNDIKVEVDKDRYRPVDNPLLFGDNSKLKNLTGWNAEFVIKDTLKDLLDYWRNKENYEDFQ